MRLPFFLIGVGAPLLLDAAETCRDGVCTEDPYAFAPNGTTQYFLKDSTVRCKKYMKKAVALTQQVLKLLDADAKPTEDVASKASHIAWNALQQVSATPSYWEACGHSHASVGVRRNFLAAEQPQNL
jgi:hypothetical protein